MDAIAVNIPVQDPLAATVGHAIRAGDIDELKQLLAETPGLALANLLDRGAPLNWISPWDHLTPLDAAQRAGADELVKWLRDQGAISAREGAP